MVETKRVRGWHGQRAMADANVGTHYEENSLLLKSEPELESGRCAMTCHTRADDFSVVVSFLLFCP